ncbi:uncharacterized protein PHACADRAFT_260266 [Phanerochaete carnosa HHB-10118-sp]|uniref:Heterokaryon incompatibility domain-containing protein n=1 Tax=Phanerochaete carnosa (strain HHB-10118-sp) TaxID=650164 RepID=K5W3S0_PHACS|nr:uncharacterized protein PHACADRAFT_260266 [Phanerochaete carnosa HHB-10118-sp]EKM53770.1 hypothetical protein PHACADRAFT_260266 [Phanerochaete carnosa HHB-10118-sp]
MAQSGVPLEQLFASDGPGKSFSLVPEPRSSVPLQWAHFGPGAIPNALADTPCAAMNVTELLERLNDVLGTSYSLNKPGLEQCLNHFLRSSRDFGQVYGSLRPHWQSGFAQLLSNLTKKRNKDEVMRQNVVDGSYISNARVLPRRVWDLYSNRVLPFYAINPSRDWLDIPTYVWTVSHSWVHESARTYVSTPINDHEWPVPTPRDITLDHVRVELLNLGAEYVWMDVLCLRQRGRPEDEEQRKEEWKLDVPTIGRVYSSPPVPCVTYFNGLGLPFDPSPEVLSSDRHWSNRVWTAQEATRFWLPGGTTGTVSADTWRFFRDHLPRSIPSKHVPLFDALAFGVPAMRGRHCTTELDRIHGLAYLLNCETLPIYDEDMSPDRAWTALLKHVDPLSRWQIALRHVICCPDDISLFPSWQVLMQYEQPERVTHTSRPDHGALLSVLDNSCLQMTEPGIYFHKAVPMYGPVDIDRQGKKDESGHETLKLQSRGASGRLSCYEIEDCRVGGTVLRGVKYVILKLTWVVWLVAEVTGERQVGGESALEVVKRGCISVPSNQLTLPPWYNKCVVYISEEEYQQRKRVAS